MSKRRSVAFKQTPTVTVRLNVPRDLNRFIPSVVHEPRLRIIQDRYRHRRIPVVVKSGRGVVRRTIKVIPLSRKVLRPAITLFREGVRGRAPRIVHSAFRRVVGSLAREMHRRRYSEKKSRRDRVSAGHINSVRRDFGLLSANSYDARSLMDAALVQRAVFGG